MGAAGGGDDVLAHVEKLTKIMHFDVLQLLGQGCNGAVFKVGRGACACACFSFSSRVAVLNSLLARRLCPACLLGYFLTCLLHYFRCEQAKVVHNSVPNGVFVALKILYNLGLSSTGAIQQRYSVDFAMLQKLPRHRHINRFITQFIDLPPDAVFDELSPVLKEAGSRMNKVTGLMQRLKAQFYVVELHDMTLEAALDRFPVSTRSYYPAPYACLAV